MPHHDFSAEIVWTMTQDSGGQEVVVDILDEAPCLAAVSLDDVFGELAYEMAVES